MWLQPARLPMSVRVHDVADDAEAELLDQNQKKGMVISGREMDVVGGGTKPNFDIGVVVDQ